MRTIKTELDIVISHRAELLPSEVLDYVEDLFKQLRIEPEDEVENQFRLGENGYIFLLKAGDNVRDLGSVGLNREHGGLLGSCPEYVELLDL